MVVEAHAGEPIDERVARLHALLKVASKSDIQTYDERLNMSWIYHDSALEGVVYSPEELHAAVSDRVASDSALIPAYDEIRHHMNALRLVRDLGQKKKLSITLEVVKEIAVELAPDDVESKGQPKYRKDMPVHRLYFHDITTPDKISYKMRNFIQWIAAPETKRSMHPLRLGAKAHAQLLHIYPFAKHSGKVARLVMNLVLLSEGYPPVVIHATERQRYYEALKAGDEAVSVLVNEAMSASVESSIRWLESKNPTA